MALFGKKNSWEESLKADTDYKKAQIKDLKNEAKNREIQNEMLEKQHEIQEEHLREQREIERRKLEIEANEKRKQNQILENAKKQELEILRKSSLPPELLLKEMEEKKEYEKWNTPNGLSTITFPDSSSGILDYLNRLLSIYKKSFKKIDEKINNKIKEFNFDIEKHDSTSGLKIDIEEFIKDPYLLPCEEKFEEGIRKFKRVSSSNNFENDELKVLISSFEIAKLSSVKKIEDFNLKIDEFIPKLEIYLIEKLRKKKQKNKVFIIAGLVISVGFISCFFLIPNFGSFVFLVLMWIAIIWFGGRWIYGKVFDK